LSKQWTASQLSELTDGEELVLVLTRGDKPTLRVPVWSVTIDGVAFVRSYLGVTRMWYRRVLDAPRQAIVLEGDDVPVDFEVVPASHAVNARIGAEFLRKYAADDYRDAMITPMAIDATLRILPS
jgi:hypothetical protein